MLQKIIICLLITAVLSLKEVTCNTQQSYPFANEGFAEGVRGSKDDYYLQTGKHILHVDQQLGVLQSINEPIDSNMQCQRVFKHPDGQHVLSVCLEYGAFPYLSAYKCTDSECKQVGQTVEVWNCGQQFSKLEVIGNTIIVLNADRDYPYTGYQNIVGRVMFMNYILTDTDFQLKLPQYYVDSYFFGSLTPIEIVDFSIYKEDEDAKYTLFLADRDNGLLWVDCQLRQNQLVPGTKGRIDLKSHIYFKQNEIVLTSRVIAKSGDTYDILAASNNNNHNIISVTLSNGVVTNYFVKISLTRYLDWSGRNRLDVYKNYFAISYWSPTMINAISIYKLAPKGEVLLTSIDPLYTILHSQQTYEVVFFGENMYNEVVLNYRSSSNVITQCDIGN